MQQMTVRKPESGVEAFATLLMCSLLLGCQTAAVNDSSSDNPVYLSNHEIESYRFNCGLRSVNLGTAFDELLPEIERTLAENDLGELINTIDFTRIDLVVVTLTHEMDSVRYLLFTTVNPNIRLIGEGGLEIVVDPCKMLVQRVSQVRIS